jgi:lipopolysaccharide transport system permease protein
MSQVVIRSARPTPIGDVLSLPHMVRHLWGYRDLIRQFAVREVLVRHKGTALGLTWAIAQPLLTLGIYTFIFGFVFQNRWGAEKLGGPEWANFLLNFFAGFVLFGFFSETVNRSPTFITDHPNLVRKVVFPLEIFPVTAVGAGLVYSGCSLVLLLLTTLILAGTFSWTIVFFPLVLLPLLMLTLGVSWFFASMGVFVRDVRQVVPVMTQLLFFVTPIFYDIESPGIRPVYKQIIRLNPFTTIVESGRRTLLWGQPPEWLPLGIVTALSLVVMILGYAWFAKSKRGLADVI